uniref:Copia-type pol polyprotein n=3 Tax=Oryza sativa subsp. japonica TaxID=39947 RepID=A0A5S6RAY7_ORYSJ|nr:Putative copia-type pol polyprotein [Oryza sativa]AAP52115.1 retrotransposon protein, putative, Ty1-copia subclass [Oryza sativa Japonica Group]
MPLGELRRLPFRLLRSFSPLPGRPLARRADAAITVVVVVLPASGFNTQNSLEIWAKFLGVTSMAVPEAHANVVGNSHGRKRGHGEKKGKGKGSIIFKGKSKGKPRGKGKLKKVTGESSGVKQDNCYRCGGRGHWSCNCHVPKHLVELYQQSMNEKKSQHESHFTIEPEAQIEKHDDMLINVKDGGDVRMDDDWDNLLEKDDDIFGDLKETRYFHTLTKKTGNIMTIAGSNAHIVGTGSATLVLPMGTHIFVKDALLYPDSKRTLLNFKDIRANSFHIETEIEQDAEYLLISKIDGYQKQVVERLPSSPSGLYYTYIKPTKEYVAMKSIFRNPESFRVWHDRLGHPGLGMMRRIINNFAGHNVETKDFPNPEDFICPACAKGKLITRPSLLKIRDESPVFLARIQGDICGPIQPLSGPFRYFMVLIDASTRWSHVDLLSTRNHAFPKLISQIIRLKASFPDSCVQSIRMDNAGEFRSKAFDDYYLAMGIKDPTGSWGYTLVMRLSIIKYLEPMTGDLHTARYADCIFDEDHFPTLGGVRHLEECRDVIWNATGMQSLDPRTSEVELEVQRIINLQNIANKLPDAFTDYKGVTRSHIPAVNAPERVEVTQKVTDSALTPHPRKRGRPPGARDKVPWRRPQRQEPEPLVPLKESIEEAQPEVEKAPEEATQPKVEKAPEEATQPEVEMVPEGHHPEDEEPSVLRVYLGTRRSEHSNSVVMGNHDELEEINEEISTNYADTGELHHRKTTIVDKHFASKIADIMDPDPEPKSMAECQKHSDWDKWKAAIEAELRSLYKRELMDVVTAYLYGSLDSEIYMRVPEGLKIPNPKGNRNMYSVRLQRSLYGLKQSRRMWFNRLSNYLLKRDYLNNDHCLCVFIKSLNGFCIISVYVDDFNIIGTTEDIKEAMAYLKTEFEMKDLGKTKFCLGLQLKHLPEGVFMHQSTYTKRVLGKFNMDKCHPLKTPMVVRSLEADKDPFKPKEDDEEVLGPEVPYLSAIGALMYLANCTRPNIAFAVNLLARYSATPTRRHWVGVKTILKYLRGTQDLGLWFPKNQDPSMVGYVDAGYMSNPRNARSQTRFVFLCGNTAISWRFVKQTLVATSTNHSEIIALYEATREYVGLMRMIGHIQKSCGLNIDNTPTIIYEDNATCVAQIHMGYVKSNFTKHITLKFFYPHELQKSGEINVLQTKSCENLADLFTKSLPASSFHRCVRGIGMRRLSELQESGGANN